MPAVADPEAVVRRYLVALNDPEALVDRDVIARFEQEVAAANDPIEKLRALTKLERAAAVDVESCAQDFVEHAREWAERNDVSVNAFRQLGVAEDVLRGAGLLGRRRGSGRRPGGTRGARPSAVTAVELQAAIPRQFTDFTFHDVMSSLGGSPMTVRKAVTGLVEGGAVERIGPASGWAGPGRAPIVYRVVRS